MLTVNEVADILKVDANTVYNYIYKGILPAHKIGEHLGRSNRRWRINNEDFVKFLGDNKEEDND